MHLQMETVRISFYIKMILLLAVASASAQNHSENKELSTNESLMNKKNPVTYFEIPVINMERAKGFYKAVFDFDFEMDVIDENVMALFPFKNEEKGVTGALAKGEIYKPTTNGVLIYFSTDSIDETLTLAVKHGGRVLFPKTPNDWGFVAEFEDSEGNRIALHQELANKAKDKSEILGLRTTIYKVNDIQKAKEWYTEAFGVQPYFDEPYYVGFNIGEYELGLQPDDTLAGSKAASVVTYWGVENIQEVYDRLVSLGAMENEKPYSVGGDLMTATVKDPFGNVIGLIYNPHFKLKE